MKGLAEDILLIIDGNRPSAGELPTFFKLRNYISNRLIRLGKEFFVGCFSYKIPKLWVIITDVQRGEA